MFKDNQKKRYIIVNRTMAPALLMNATDHLAAGIMQKAEEKAINRTTNPGNQRGCP